DADLAAAYADALRRILVAHGPGADVEVVDVLLDVEVAGQPGEVVPVAHLPFHVGPVLLAREHPDTAAQIVGLKATDVADGAVVDAANHLAVVRRIAQAQAGDDGQIAFAGFGAGGEHAPHAGGIDGDRLFGKDVAVRLDGGAQMRRPEMRRRAQ